MSGGALHYGDAAARLVSQRFGGSYANTAAIKAIPADRRVDGMVVVDMATQKFWIFDADSSTSASATVLAPDAGTGRWLVAADPDDAVTAAKIADGATAAWGTSTHDDAEALVLVTAPTGVYLSGICTVKCSEAIVNGGGGAPTFSAGDGTTADAFATAAEYTAKDSLGDRFTFGFELEPGAELTITNTDGTGGDAGAFLHHCIFGPVASWA